MDVSIHRVDSVTDLTEPVGAWLLFLPPYLPDLDPAGEVFSKIKGIMKQNDAPFQACNEPRVLITLAFGVVSKEDSSPNINHSLWLYVITLLHDLLCGKCITESPS